jgi:hypothetical protein
MPTQERLGDQESSRVIEVFTTDSNPREFIMKTVISRQRNLGAYEYAMKTLRVDASAGDLLYTTYGAASIGANLWGIKKIAEGVRKKRPSDVVKGLALLFAASAFGYTSEEINEFTNTAREGQTGLRSAIRSIALRS